jgi:hypothetical protein
MIGTLFCGLGKALGGCQCPESEVVFPEITIYQVDSAVIAQELEADGIINLYPIPIDKEYFYTTEWGWEMAIKYVRDVFEFPIYVSDKRDCDFFAILMKALLENYFGLNTCAFIIGNHGSHAFNRLKTEFGRENLEPQTGKIANDYLAEYALI